MRQIDITDQTFGRLTAVALAQTRGRERWWACRCACGVEKEVRQASLTRGLSKSCGCLRDETTEALSTVHGHTRDRATTKLYRAWLNMHARCYNVNRPQFKDWGGRGIRVCDRWQVFETFAADMGEPPTPQHTLDRWPDNDGHYEPGNCRWATRSQQSSNQRPRKATA